MRNKLKSIGRSRKLRLDAFDFAATSFAVRFAQRKQLMEAPADDVAKFLARLEKIRKRAKRAAISEVGKFAFDVDSGAEARQTYKVYSFCLQVRIFSGLGNLRIATGVIEPHHLGLHQVLLWVALGLYSFLRSKNSQAFISICNGT
jgi:hypothetical protein